MPVYAYCRHSTNKQKNSQDVQIGRLTEFARDSKFDLTHTFDWDGGQHNAWFLDPDTTSKIKLMARAEGGILHRILVPGDIVIATRLDRLFRSCQEMEFYIEKWVVKGGVKFYLADQGGLSLNVDTPDGRAMLRMMAAMAELEREVTAERTHKAMAHKKKAGERTTVNPGPGFRWQKKGDKQIRVANFAELKLMAEMLRWKEELNLSVPDIVMHLQKPHIDPTTGEKYRCHREFTVKGKQTFRPWTHSGVYRALQVARAIRGDQEAVDQIKSDDPAMVKDIEEARHGEQ
jgi:DNA invertase Pin-like site-specific DNA recombinase